MKELIFVLSLVLIHYQAFALSTYNSDGSTSPAYKDGDNVSSFHRNGTVSGTHIDVYGGYSNTFNSNGTMSYTFTDTAGNMTTYNPNGTISRTPGR